MKEIPGFEGLYAATEEGFIVSLRSKKALRPTKQKDGYLTIGLSKNGNRIWKTVHFYIASAYLGPREKSQVNHINGVKSDNRPSNLQYVTAKENIQHAINNNLFPRGQMVKVGCLTEKEVLQILSDEKASNAELARRFGVSDKTIRNIRNGVTWKHITRKKKP